MAPKKNTKKDEEAEKKKDKTREKATEENKQSDAEEKDSDEKIHEDKKVKADGPEDKDGDKPEDVSSSKKRGDNSAPSNEKNEEKIKAKEELKEEAPALKKEIITAGQLFDLLGSLREVLSRSTNICVEEKEYKVNGYGPKPWAPVITEDVASRYRVILIGRERVPYIIKDPLFTMKINKIDDIITETYRAVTHTLNTSLKFLKEPSSMRMMDQQRIEPERLGFPYSQLLVANLDINLIHNAVHRFLNPTRRSTNFNYSDGVIFNGSHIEDALREAFDVSQREMRVLGDAIEQEELRTRKNIPDDVKKPVTGNNVLFELVMNPFILTGMFNGLPRFMRFSAGLILELQKPDVLLGPIDANTLQKTASISLTRSSSITSMFSIDYTPDMSEQINAFIISLIVPGLIEFDVDLSDINSSDHPLRLLCAAFSKLLFSRSDTQIWNSITNRGARVVEQAIVEACVTANILVVAPHPAPLPLNRVNAAPGIPLHDLNGMVTDGTGAGWREGPARRFAPHPPGMPYATCCDRQRFVHDIENVEDLELPERIMHYNTWRVASSLSSLISVANRNGEDRSSYSGIPQIFKLLANRIFDFYAVINEYNSLNWYSSLRPPNNVLQTLYVDGSEEPTIIPIRGKTILYLAKSLCSKTAITRRTPYLAQVKAECAIARDCVESAVKHYILNETVRIYRIPEESFRRSEVMNFIMPEEGPLNSHMRLLVDSGLSSSIGGFYRCVEMTPMYDIMTELADVVLRHPIDYGVMPSIELGTRVSDRTVRTLSEFSINNKPYTNIGIFEDDGEDGAPPNIVRSEMSFIQMQPLINTFNLQQSGAVEACWAHNL